MMSRRSSRSTCAQPMSGRDCVRMFVSENVRAKMCNMCVWVRMLCTSAWAVVWGRDGTGMPWGDTMSAPRTVHMPRLVAKTTMGDRGDSRARLRKVKHSRSSMCTWAGEGRISGPRLQEDAGDVLKRDAQVGRARGTRLVDEEHAGHQLRDTLVDVLGDDLEAGDKRGE
jgi:hypothetical protein